MTIANAAYPSPGTIAKARSGNRAATTIGSSIASDNCYDQVAMFPKTTRSWLVDVGVFDFDAVVFRELWERGDQKAFNGYVRYYLSDHRVMWVRLGVD